MKKVSRRSFLQAAGAASAAGILASCASESTATSTSTAASTGTSTAASEATGGSKSGYEDDPNEQVTLKFISYSETVANTEKVLATFNEKLAEYLPNTKVEFQLIEGTAYDEQTKLIVAAGEDFDLMWAGDWKGDSVTKLGGGAFMPIGALMDEYAPELYDFYPESSWAAGMFKGELYGVISHQSMVNGVDVCMRESYMDKYSQYIDTAAINEMASWDNKDVTCAEILRQFEPVLEKAKADGMDLKQALVGNIFYEGFRKTDPLYIVSSIRAILGIERFSDDLKVLNLMATDEARELAKLAAEWNIAGYMPSDVASFKQLPFNTLNSFIGIGNYGLPSKQTSTQAINLYGEDNISVGLVVPPYNTAMASPQAVYFNANGKHPARAMRFLDALVRNVDLYNYYCFGEEGVDYKMVDGVAIVSDPQTYKMRDWLVGNTDYSLSRAADVDYLAEAVAAMEAAPYAPVLGFNLDSSSIKTEVASVTVVFDEYFDSINFGTFKENWEAKYDEFLEKLQVAGIDKVIAAAQEQLDAIAVAQGVK